MAKLIILSIVLFMAIVPITASTKRSPKRALRSVQIMTFVVTIIWTYACRNWYPELVVID